MTCSVAEGDGEVNIEVSARYLQPSLVGVEERGRAGGIRAVSTGAVAAVEVAEAAGDGELVGRNKRDICAAVVVLKRRLDDRAPFAIVAARAGLEITVCALGYAVQYDTRNKIRHLRDGTHESAV